MKRLTAILAILVPSVGCASVMTDDVQTIRFETDPPQMTVHVDNQPYVTPAEVPLGTDRNHVVKWPDGSTSAIKRTLAGSVFGNLLLGGVVGGVVDLASGNSHNNLEPKVLRWKQGVGYIDPKKEKEEKEKKSKPKPRYPSQ